MTGSGPLPFGRYTVVASSTPSDIGTMLSAASTSGNSSRATAGQTTPVMNTSPNASLFSGVRIRTCNRIGSPPGSEQQFHQSNARRLEGVSGAGKVQSAQVRLPAAFGAPAGHG